MILMRSNFYLINFYTKNSTDKSIWKSLFDFFTNVITTPIKRESIKSRELRGKKRPNTEIIKCMFKRC